MRVIIIQPVIDNRKKNTIYLSYHRITKIITNFDIVQKANTRDYILLPDLLQSVELLLLVVPRVNKFLSLVPKDRLRSLLRAAKLPVSLYN